MSLAERIKSISIKNVKGYGTKQTFQLDIIPNKPSILVAPNGFGKSSFAVAFDSLNSVRIKLHKDYYHQEDENRKPEIDLEYKDTSGLLHTLSADENSNSICSEFDIFVINSKLQAKARNIRVPGGGSRAVGSLEVPEIILVNTIPQRESIDYSITSERTNFGISGGILPNISDLFLDKNFMKKISDVYTCLDRTENIGEQEKITSFKEEVNELVGTLDTKRNAILNNSHLDILKSSTYLSQLANIIQSFGYEELDSYLASIQVSKVYLSNKQKFKATCEYKKYEIAKKGFNDIFDFFHSTWRNVRPVEKSGQLVLSIPKAKYISNGQRDVLTFIALLQQAKNKFNKQNCILIIDEVFDYLDDANLIAVQYYITKFIEKLKADGKKFYPLILTHLNPYYFKSYAFSDKNRKVYFLKNSNITTNSSMRKLIEKRTETLIKDNISKYFFHYHTNTLNIRNDFRNLQLKETWGETQIFHQFLETEVNKYLTNTQDYCPFSVCIALRVKIEEKVFSELPNIQSVRDEFINKHGTPSKLDFAEENGINVQETYYLLGVIYNDIAHLKNYVSNNSPLINKLENLTIKHMIKKVFE